MLKTVLNRLKPLAEGVCQSYIANDIQVADLIEWIVSQTGPADVDITSFSISEEFLRRIFFMRKKMPIKRLRIVIDFKATHKTLKLWPFIAQTVEHCFLSSNHSKVILVDGEDMKVAVVTSQNLTRGNRFESASIIVDDDNFGIIKDYLENLIKYQSVPFDELYRETIGDD